MQMLGFSLIIETPCWCLFLPGLALIAVVRVFFPVDRSHFFPRNIAPNLN